MKTKLLLLMMAAIALIAAGASADIVTRQQGEDPNFVVDAGIDMITWSDQQVQLDPNVVNNGPGDLTYYWSANPDEGVVFDSNSIEAPTVTIIYDPDANVGGGGGEGEIEVRGGNIMTGYWKNEAETEAAFAVQ